MITVTVTENQDGSAVVQLPPSMLEELGWDETTDLDLIPGEDGTITITQSLPARSQDLNSKPKQ